MTIRTATDIGGTFTDLAYVTADGRLHTEKSLSTPGQFEVGVDDVLGKAGIDRATAVASFVHGTTVVINALLERTGSTTALFTTAGFRDVLEIGRASRPALYDLRYRSPEPYVPRHLRFGIAERCDAHGEVVEELSSDDVARAAVQAREAGARAVAIAFLHSYANPDHERRAAALVRELWPEAFVTMSHEVTQEWREFERSNTAVFNAYVQEIASTYVDRLERRLDKRGIGANLRVMQSNGGAMSFAHAQRLPVTMVESGPAAGVLAAARLSAAAGRRHVITLDIGGTTAKTSLVADGEVRMTTDYRVDWGPTSPGYPIKTPVVDIVEIGAGGGSIAWVDELGRLGLGPRSAGAQPGPACYPNGGAEPTLTDANLVAGRLNPDYFLGGDMPVSVERARAALARIAAPLGLSVEDAALGVIRLANAKMINAVKLVSVRRGHDPRDFHLVAFGGGGPVHALDIGAELRVKGVVIPRAPGTFSAVGMLLAPLRADWVRTLVVSASEESTPACDAVWAAMEAQAKEHLAAEGATGELRLTRSVDMRYAGQEHTVTVPTAAGQPLNELMAAFHAAHERLYTFRMDAPAQIVNLRLAATAGEEPPAFAVALPTGGLAAAAKGTRTVLFDGPGAVEAAIYERDLVPCGAPIAGPAVIEEAGSSTVVHPGQRAEVDERGDLVVEWEKA